MVGGQAGTSVDLEPPQNGTYTDILLFQHRDFSDPNPAYDSVPANFGLNAAPGDKAKVNLWGVIYNADLPGDASLEPFQAWDNGIPYYAGGIMQTGYAVWDAAHGWGASQSGGLVQVHGICVVEDFNTDGKTDINILGSFAPYSLPIAAPEPGLIG